MSEVYRIMRPFIDLFGGTEDSERIGAYGTGKGQWIKRPLSMSDVVRHLEGEGPGIGIPPLRPDSTCVFGAIDLDEPDFEAAQEMRCYIPGQSFVERSRSGNAHVWVFFDKPIEAWVVMGLLKDACIGAGKKHVEVFPKNHDFTRVKLGNYINLPYHGDTRPILWKPAEDPNDPANHMPLDSFVNVAHANKQDPEEWRKHARWKLLSPPGSDGERSEFGEQERLHMCGEYIIENAMNGTNPIGVGHRSVVFFSLSKMLTNWKGMDQGDVLDTLREVNEASPDPIPDSELRRILGNAERGQFTSTGCDDPLMAPYVHPDCPIVARST